MYLALSISCSAYPLAVPILAILSNEDKKSSPKDMGERLPICGGGVFYGAFGRMVCMHLYTFEGNRIPVVPSEDGGLAC